MRSILVTWVITLVVVATALWVFYNNDYMTYRNYPVTFVEKSETTSCHKTSCRPRYIGLFKLGDGTYFNQDIGKYMFTQMHLGEQFELELRPFDIRQTPSQNWWFFFMPVFLFSAALAAVGMAIVVTVKEIFSTKRSP